MRTIISLLLAILYHASSAQHEKLIYRNNYAFIADSSALIPLQGGYSVEYLARGRWWTYTPPRTPVDYPGERKALIPGLPVNGTPLLMVETEAYPMTTDNKLRVVRDSNTMIMDINPYGDTEARMLTRMAVPPRPPVLLPFRRGWYMAKELLEEPRTTKNTERFDALWTAERAAVLALYDTVRYTFSLETNGPVIGPPTTIRIWRDANYARHLLRFPASGPGTWFELYPLDSLAEPTPPMALRVAMPPDGDNDAWVDITDLPPGRCIAFLRWGEVWSVFYLTVG